MPSCYEEDQAVALVYFSGGVPDFLSSPATNPEGSWQVEMGDDDVTFDRHFFGFTQLYPTEPGREVNAE